MQDTPFDILIWYLKAILFLISETNTLFAIILSITANEKRWFLITIIWKLSHGTFTSFSLSFTAHTSSSVFLREVGTCHDSTSRELLLGDWEYLKAFL